MKWVGRNAWSCVVCFIVDYLVKQWVWVVGVQINLLHDHITHFLQYQQLFLKTNENTATHSCNIQPYCLLSHQIICIYIYMWVCVCIIKGNIFMCHSVDCTTKTCWVVDEVILSVKAFLVMWIAPPAPAVRPLTLFAFLTLSKKLLVPLKFSKLAAPQIAPAHT